MHSDQPEYISTPNFEAILVTFAGIGILFMHHDRNFQYKAGNEHWKRNIPAKQHTAVRNRFFHDPAGYPERGKESAQAGYAVRNPAA